MMEDFNGLRQPGAADGEALASLIEALGYRRPAPSEVRRLLSVVQRSDAEAWLLEARDGEPVGLLTLLFFPSLREGGIAGRVEELVVAENWRGRGVGSRLLEHAVHRARAHGALWLELQTARSRENYARGFYPSRGFDELDAALFRRWLAERPSRARG